jgi:DNA polymerase III alpha subunit (gram-positive type)
MDKTNTIILVLIGVVLFSVGGGLGIIYQEQKTFSDNEENQTPVNNLISKAVLFVAVQGEVIDINDKTLVVSREGETTRVFLKEDFVLNAPYLLNKENKNNLENINIGDFLNIEAKILKNGELEGQSVAIIKRVN